MERVAPQEYEEIVEECETKFEREIEFEIFRGNLTAAEAEEIEADLEKIKTWFERVVRATCSRWPSVSVRRRDSEVRASARGFRTAGIRRRDRKRPVA